MTPTAPQVARLRAPDVKFVGSPDSVVDAMLELARVTAADVVYDLGSGDGRIPIAAAQKYGARGVGIEIDPMRVREANDRLARARIGDRVRFVHQDLFEADISEATVVTLFLLPRLNVRLLPKLKRELRPGARIVSHQFDMGPEWPPEETRDVEGLTYVVEGLFRHADNLGGEYILLPAGSAQRMTLGSGAWHSEQNASKDEPMRFIQMWIMPAERGLPPSVEQKVFTKEDRTDRWLRIISGDGGESVLVHQEASVFVSSVSAGGSVEHSLGSGRGAYLYVISGEIDLNGEQLSTGDAAKVDAESMVRVEATEPSELIMVDVRTR